MGAGAGEAPLELAVLIDFQVGMSRQFRIVVEKHSNGYVAYPLGAERAVVGEGDTSEEALADVRSAIQFHIETFGPDVLPPDSEAIEAFLTETTVSV